jgi:hypothetical protein
MTYRRQAKQDKKVEQDLLECTYFFKVVEGGMLSLNLSSYMKTRTRSILSTKRLFGHFIGVPKLVR